MYILFEILWIKNFEAIYSAKNNTIISNVYWKPKINPNISKNYVEDLTETVFVELRPSWISNNILLSMILVDSYSSLKLIVCSL